MDVNDSNNVTPPTSSRVLYCDLVKRIETIPTSRYKYEEIFLITDLPWREIYLWPRRVALDIKTSEFQYKFFTELFIPIKFLYKMGIAASPLCTFCGRFEHLFIHWNVTSSFWLSVTRWLKNYFFNLPSLNAICITFGFFRKDLLLPNHIMIVGKQIIFQCRNLNMKRSLSLLRAKIKETFTLELYIAN